MKLVLIKVELMHMFKCVIFFKQEYRLFYRLVTAVHATNFRIMYIVGNFLLVISNIQISHFCFGEQHSHLKCLHIFIVTNDPYTTSRPKLLKTTNVYSLIGTNYFES